MDTSLYGDYSKRIINVHLGRHHDILYRQKEIEEYSIISSSFFIHKAYLEMLFDPLMVPDGALEYIEHSQNCVSILMNIVVTKFIEDTGWYRQCGSLAVENILLIRKMNYRKRKVTGMIIVTVYSYSYRYN